MRGDRSATVHHVLTADPRQADHISLKQGTKAHAVLT